MTQDQFNRAMKIRDAVSKIGLLKDELEINYDKLKSDSIDKASLLKCLDNYRNVLSELTAISEEEFKKV